jgi:hypothetical protein
MQKRKVTVEVEIDDEMVNSIEDIEREILAQNIHKQVAVNYLESLKVDLSQKVDARKGSKKVHIKTHHFEFDPNRYTPQLCCGWELHACLEAQERK